MPNDTLVVLTGDGMRIPYAVKILKRYPRTSMFISGVGAGQLADIVGDTALWGRIKIDQKSKTTYENSVEISKYVLKKNYNRIVLITSDYHIRRARLLLEKQLYNVEIAVCPVPSYKLPTNVRLQRWGMEYVKYLGTSLGFTARGQ